MEMAPPSLKYVSVFIFELNCTRPFWTWFTSRLQLYLPSVFLLSSLGVLAGAKANLLWLGSHFLCSMYWCMYLLSDCFPDKVSWEAAGTEILTLSGLCSVALLWRFAPELSRIRILLSVSQPTPCLASSGASSSVLYYSTSLEDK